MLVNEIAIGVLIKKKEKKERGQDLLPNESNPLQTSPIHSLLHLPFPKNSIKGDFHPKIDYMASYHNQKKKKNANRIYIKIPLEG